MHRTFFSVYAIFLLLLPVVSATGFLIQEVSTNGIKIDDQTSVIIPGKSPQISISVTVKDDDGSFSYPEEGTSVNGLAAGGKSTLQFVFDQSAGKYVATVEVDALGIAEASRMGASSYRYSIQISNSNRTPAGDTAAGIELLLSGKGCYFGDERELAKQFAAAKQPTPSQIGASDSESKCTLSYPFSVNTDERQEVDLYVSNTFKKGDIFDVSAVGCLPIKGATYEGDNKYGGNKRPISLSCLVTGPFYSHVLIEIQKNPGVLAVPLTMYFSPDPQPTTISDCKSVTVGRPAGSISYTGHYTNNPDKQLENVGGCKDDGKTLIAYACIGEDNKTRTETVCDGFCYPDRCVTKAVCPSTVEFKQLGKKVKVKLLDASNDPVTAIVKLTLSHDSEELAQELFEFPKSGIETTVDEAFKDVSGMTSGTYTWTFTSPDTQCAFSYKKSITFEENENAWQRFAHFVQGFFW